VGVDDAVLDIGCGTGVDLDAVAGLTARAIGIDLSETMARTARDRGDAGATFAVADGQHLPFPAGSFDAVCLRAVLVHTPRPELTIAELSRVLRPGGRAVLSEPDHGSHVVATSEQEVLDRLLHHRRGRFRHPLIGRSLVGLAADAGLAVTGCQVFPIVHRSLSSALASGGPFGAAVEAAVADGAISPSDADRFTGSLDRLDRQGTFFFAAMSVVITVQA
jgi:SAM-dependent methyltransferase